MRWLKFLAMLFFLQTSFAQEAVIQFEQANQLYRSGDYVRAASAYEGLISNGYESAALYYNLGNAYFKMDSIPAAILQLERARLLSPRDEDVQYNLRLANLRVIDKIEPIPQLFFLSWWKSFIDMFSADGWGMMAVVSLWCAAAFGVIFMLGRTVTFQRITFLGAVVSLMLCALSFTGTFQRVQRERNVQSAIVFSPSVSVKSAPDPQSTDLFILHEGVKIEFMDAVGEWRKIRLADGKVGWLSVEDVRVI